MFLPNLHISLLLPSAPASPKSPTSSRFDGGGGEPRAESFQQLFPALVRWAQLVPVKSTLWGIFSQSPEHERPDPEQGWFTPPRASPCWTRAKKGPREQTEIAASDLPTPPIAQRLSWQATSVTGSFEFTNFPNPAKNSCWDCARAPGEISIGRVTHSPGPESKSRGKGNVEGPWHTAPDVCCVVVWRALCCEKAQLLQACPDCCLESLGAGIRRFHLLGQLCFKAFSILF